MDFFFYYLRNCVASFSSLFKNPALACFSEISSTICYVKKKMLIRRVFGFKGWWFVAKCFAFLKS